MAKRRWMLLALAFTSLAGLGLFSWYSRSAPVAERAKTDPPRYPAQLPQGMFAFTGTDSCSGRACHGSLEPRAAGDQPVLQDEYTKWLLRDRHARAFDVLYEPRSHDIARNLAGPGKQVIPAHTDLRCLACHSMPAPPGVNADTTLGVGCETCHGAAQKWLALHTTDAWKKRTAKEKRADGMIPVKDTAACVQACAGCHVGAPAGDGYPLRDVNHDLIAAGHPRLNFEYAAYRANLPPHWNAKAQKHAPDDQARAWAIGQVVSAEQALKLLGHRSDPQKNPWPEFAEYDCYACHHDLSAPSWRQERGYGSRLPGALPWGAWYFSMPERLAGAVQNPEAASSLDNIRRAMQRPLPKNIPIADGLTRLGGLRDKLGGFDQRALLSLLAKEKNLGDSWDLAEQFFLAACALTPVEQPLPQWLQELDPLRAFAQNLDSPRRFQPQAFSDRFRAGLKQAAGQ